MAITNNGTKVSVRSGDIPSGYTKPTITEFADYEYINSIDVVLDKATIDEADPVVTFTALVAAITSAVTARITTDYIGTNTVDIWTDFKTVKTNLTSNDAIYKADAPTYVCGVDIFIKTA